MKRIIKYTLSVILAALTVLSSCTPKETDTAGTDDTTAPVTSGTEAVTTEDETADPAEEKDGMDLIMLYEIDNGMSINARPDHGWFPLNPEYPDDPQPGPGMYRVTTSLLGTYDNNDKNVIRQHFYWMAAMGIDAVQCDITNTRSPRLPGYDGMAKYFKGTMTSFTSVLDVSAEKPENYKNPKAYVSIRLFGEEYDGLQMLLDDLYDIYGEHGDGWYKFDDGSDRADKPFIVIFADWHLIEKWSKGDKFPFDDERFNIRWCNGYLANYMTDDGEGGAYFEENDPVWLFIENVPGDKEGYYKPFYKKGKDGTVEMMQTWASLYLGGTDWDGLTDLIDGKTCIERYSEPVAKYKPKALIVNRWSYSLSWYDQPQEGITRNKSTHIEPNVDWGFRVYDSVANVLYSLEGKTPAPPPAPKITKIDNGLVFFDTAGMPLEACFSETGDFKDSEWIYIDVAKGTDPGIKTEGKLYVKVRGIGGECAGTAEFDYVPGKDPSVIEDDGIITTPEQFANIQPKGEYTLGADIDMSGAAFSGITVFNGKLDGKGHTVKNLTMTGGSGIFTLLEGAEIRDLMLDNVHIESDGLFTGILSGKAVRSVISGVKVTNSSISGMRFLGGLSGTNDHSAFENIVLDNVTVSVDPSVTDTDTIGGVAGYNEFGTNVALMFRGTVDAPNSDTVGGIIGCSLGNIAEAGNGVEKCFAFGTVNGKSTVGGIIGKAHAADNSWPGPVKDCGAFLDHLSEGAGRICGSFGEGCLSGNYALETLLPDAADKGDDRRDGADITATEAEKLLDKAGLSS